METEDGKEEEHDKRSGSDVSTLERQKVWEPSFYYTTAKEIYYYAGHEISIWESLDSYGATIWPAALALCQYLDYNRGTVNLMDKAVLEIGSGTGLVSIVASLLGGWVTAGDLPEVMSNLRGNLSRNTRGRCKYTPQAVELSWGYEMEQTFPRSVYRYDYVLAADVVYHHNFLEELLFTMCHFCQPGTTLIWANKTRFESDLVFVENFKKAFHTELLADVGEVKIYSATTKDLEEAKMIPVMAENQEERNQKERGRSFEEDDISAISKAKKQDQHPEEAELKSECGLNLEEKKKKNETQVDRNREFKQESEMSNNLKEQQHEEWNLDENSPAEGGPLAGSNEQTTLAKHRDDERSARINDANSQTDEKNKNGDDIQNCTESVTNTDMVKNCTESATDTDMVKTSECDESNAQLVFKRKWIPTVYYKLQKEIHYFMGHKITIEESIDSYGGMIWPGAVALCKFLETPAGQQQINLLDKETLELGAGTGLLSIVATLLGAKLTSTDLPEILGNLRCNLNRNTRAHRKHEPRVAALSWGHDLEENFPASEYHYDYVLAADVVYHHDYLAELLATMRHFCKPGTNLIWANKVRYPSDLDFIENFKKAFDHTLITELDDVRIYLATYKETDEDGTLKQMNKDEEMEKEYNYRNEEMGKYVQRAEEKVLQEQEHTEGNDADEHAPGKETQTEQDYGNNGIEWNVDNDMKRRRREELVMQQQEEETEGHYTDEDIGKKETECVSVEREEDSQGCREPESTPSVEEQRGSGTKEEDHHGESQGFKGSQPPAGETEKSKFNCQKSQTLSDCYKLNKDISHYYFANHEISIDFYGATIWPAASVLCEFLETAVHQQIKLLDKSVLELGAGSGLVSIVATLLGAQVTATDQPKVLYGLRNNLYRNTKCHRRYKPRVEALCWGHKLEETFPSSTHRYDYILTADVVFHHDFLDELLDTMRHFCQPGTTLIWANKVRYPSDLVFTENFQKAFNTSLIVEMNEVKIYSATSKECGDRKDLDVAYNAEMEHRRKEFKPNPHKTRLTDADVDDWEEKKNLDDHIPTCKQIRQDVNKTEVTRKGRNVAEPHTKTEVHEAHEETKIAKDREGKGMEKQYFSREPRNKEREEEHRIFKEEITEEEEEFDEAADEELTSFWLHSEVEAQRPVYSGTKKHKMGFQEVSNENRKLCEERHFFAGHEIRIIDRLEPFGPTERPAALALCKFLESNPEQINLKSKAVLELGAGTGLVSIVASILGAWVTATDKPAILDNLSSNLSRNTRGISRHRPQVEALRWKDNLSLSFPRATYYYDIVLATDVAHRGDRLDELLAAMRHFCQPGTALIWADRVQTQAELSFTDRFKRAFATTLLTETGPVKVYMAKTRERHWAE